jgi:uncharacterized Zn-binding protein involved in type VI secretion
MPLAARVTDPTTHGFPLMPGLGSLNVMIGSLPAWRAIIDQHACLAVSISGADGVGSVIVGSPTVSINNQMACRQMDIVVEKPGLALGPMDPILMGCPTVEIGGPTVPAATLALALQLLQTGGSGDATDEALVAQQLVRMPPGMLQTMLNQNQHVVVCRGSVTDYRADLRGVHPRGWPPGATWDTVPGVFTPDRNEVVIAVIGHGTPEGAHVPRTGEGHGSVNMVIHESTHAVDHAPGGDRSATDPSFTAAHTADAPGLQPYETQPGTAGQEESYAESAARYYSGDPNDATNHPNLNNYWSTNPVGNPPPRGGGGGAP